MHTLHLPILLLLGVSTCEVLDLVASSSTIPSSSKRNSYASSMAFSSLEVLSVLI